MSDTEDTNQQNRFLDDTASRATCLSLFVDLSYLM